MSGVRRKGSCRSWSTRKLKRILGAALRGIEADEADEAVHAILNVMYANAPYTFIQRSIPTHPTVSELIATLLGDSKPLPV